MKNNNSPPTKKRIIEKNGIVLEFCKSLISGIIKDKNILRYASAFNLLLYFFKLEYEENPV